MSSTAAPPAAAAPAKVSVLPFIIAATLLALSQGLGQGFITANMPQLAGNLGVSASDASWLMAAYMLPRASLPLMLTKLRTQYGLLKFAKIGAAVFVVVALANCFITDFRSALILQFLLGCASAPLSTLAFLYMLEPMSQKMKLVLGLPMALGAIMAAPSFARVISPYLVGDGSFVAVHMLTLGLAALALMLVLRLPLAPQPQMKVLQTLDFVTFALIAFSFGGITVAFIRGPIEWWFEAPWIGWLLAASVVSLTCAILIELRRKAPLIDFRWIASPAMLQMSGAMLIFRVLLSEQSAGAPRMFQVLGFGNDSLVGLFAVISVATVAAPLACLAFLRPGKEPYLHSIALIMIAVGAFMDSNSTVLTRPIDMVLSQMLIAFAGMIFMAPAMVMGLLSALRRGPSYIMSFIIIFISTQSLGGMIGSGIFTTITNHRQALHYATLTEQLTPASPSVQASIAGNVAQLAQSNPDMAFNKLRASAMLIEDATRQSWVMAYNDAYWLTGAVALAVLALLVLHVLYLEMTYLMGVPRPSPIPSPNPPAKTS